MVEVEKLIKIVNIFNHFSEQTEESKILKSINFGSHDNSVFKMDNNNRCMYFVRCAIILKYPYKTDLLYFLRTGKIQGDVLKL